MNQKKTILITSATHRIGLALTVKSLQLGYSVVAHYRSHKTELVNWLSTNTWAKDRVTFIKKHLTPDNSANLIDLILKKELELVGLVNNASLFTTGNLKDPDHFYETIRTNTLVPLAMTQSFCNSDSAQWVVNITDAKIAPVNLKYQNYRISKAFLTELSSQMAVCFSPVRVNSIAPGAILPAPDMDKKEFKSLARAIPQKRHGTLQDISQAFEYLISAEYTTGQTIRVDGGWGLV